MVLQDSLRNGLFFGLALRYITDGSINGNDARITSASAMPPVTMERPAAAPRGATGRDLN